MPIKRRRDFLTLRIKYTGGPEAWYVIEGRGSHGRFPGVAALHDVMQDIYNENGHDVASFKARQLPKRKNREQ